MELEAKLAGVQRKIDGIMRAIEDGLYQPSMKARLSELETEKSDLLVQKDAGSTIPNIQCIQTSRPCIARRLRSWSNCLKTPNSAMRQWSLFAR